MCERRRGRRRGAREGACRGGVCVLLLQDLLQSGEVCVFYYCRTYYKAVRVGGGGEWRTCAMRDDEPRPVWMSLPITHWREIFFFSCWVRNLPVGLIFFLKTVCKGAAHALRHEARRVPELRSHGVSLRRKPRRELSFCTDCNQVQERGSGLAMIGLRGYGRQASVEREVRCWSANACVCVCVQRFNLAAVICHLSRPWQRPRRSTPAAHVPHKCRASADM